MGIFSDRCDAYVGTDGKALTGTSLEEARRNPKSPRCGNRVRKQARNCSRCGSGAPGGWWKCPSCSKWCGNESQFCWNCATPLHPEDRTDVGGGVWQKKPDVFAQRFDYDMKKFMDDGINVQTGQHAIFLDGGKVAGVVGPGRHYPHTLARSVNWWGDPPPRSVVLVESGEILLPVRVTDLRTAQEIPVEYYGEVIVRWDPKGADAFIANVFKDRRQLTYSDLAEYLKGSFRYALVDFCNQSSMEDLLKDPMRRLKLEDTLQATAKVSCERYGLTLERVSATEFSGAEYEKLRAQKGEFELKRQEIEFTQRMRELTTTDKMGELAESNRLAEYVASMAHERSIGQAKMDHEFARLQQVQRHELKADEASFQMRQEMERTGHDIGIKVMVDDYNRDKTMKDADVQARARIIDAEAEMNITRGWIGVKKDKHLEEERSARAFADLISGRTPEEMVLLVPDADKRSDLLKLIEMKMKAGMNPEQMVAFIADKNPGALEALARQKSVEAGELRRILEDYKKMNEDAFNRGERMFGKGMEATIEAAKRPGIINQNMKND